MTERKIFPLFAQVNILTTACIVNGLQTIGTCGSNEISKKNWKKKKFE